jgi:hypothetical protein
VISNIRHTEVYCFRKVYININLRLPRSNFHGTIFSPFNDKRIDELESLIKEVTITKQCSVKGCDAVTIKGHHISKIISGKKVRTCDSCGDDICVDHGYKYMKSYYCLNCY